MKLLVLGGTGFFGTALLRYAVSNSNYPIIKKYGEIVVVSRNPEKFTERYPELASLPWLRLCKGDITDQSSLSALEDLGQIDHVIHAATDSTDSTGLSSMQQLDQIVTGTQNVLELSMKVNCKRFLLTSSGGAYGPQPPDMEAIPETYLGCPDPLLSTSTYGLGKRLAEHLCGIYARETLMEVVIARCFAFVGEDLPLDAHFAIGNFIRDALDDSKDCITVNGDGTPIRSYMDQKDLSCWLLTLLQQGANGEAYNVGSNIPINILDLAYLIRDLLSPNKKVLVKGTSTFNNEIRNRYIPAIDKSYKNFGLQITIPLEEAILKVRDSMSKVSAAH